MIAFLCRGHWTSATEQPPRIRLAEWIMKFVFHFSSVKNDKIMFYRLVKHSRTPCLYTWYIRWKTYSSGLRSDSQPVFMLQMCNHGRRFKITFRQVVLKLLIWKLNRHRDIGVKFSSFGSFCMYSYFLGSNMVFVCKLLPVLFCSRWRSRSSFCGFGDLKDQYVATHSSCWTHKEPGNFICFSLWHFLCSL